MNNAADDNKKSTATNKGDEVIKVAAEPKDAKSLYSNFIGVIAHKHAWTFDMVYRENNDAWLLGRYTITPSHAKMIYKVIGDRIKKHEEAHGKIDESSDY